MEYCTQCENHCPENELRCGRGRRYFGVEDSAETAGRHEHDGEGRRHEHGEEGREHGRRHEHGEEGREHGHRHEHGEERGHGRGSVRERRRFSTEEIENMEDPAELIRACGHELFHRRGREGGRGRAFGDTQRMVISLLQEAKAEGKDSLSQGELLDRLHIQPGSLSEILKKLEDKGAVQKIQDPEDRRRMSVSLAEGFDGQEAAADVQEEPELSKDNLSKNSLSRDNLSMDVLTQEEKNTLSGLLKKLLLSWQKQ